MFPSGESKSFMVLLLTLGRLWLLAVLFDFHKEAEGKFNPHKVIEVNIRVFGPVYNEEGQKYQNCGGTLISRQHVLTAAHCFLHDPEKICQPDYDSKLADSLAKNGMNETEAQMPLTLERTMVELDGLCLPNEFCKNESCACVPPKKTRPVGVNRVFIPTAFVRTHCALGDIALLELSEPVAPRPVQLARPSTPVKNPLYASGYGYNPAMVLHRDKDQLMTTKVWVLPFGQCPEQHKAEDAICADENKLDQNVCKGDSGSGLRNRNATIFGIVAYGTSCDRMANDDQKSLSMEKRNYEGAVYTNVTYYLPFICGIIANGTAAENVTTGCMPEDVERAPKQPYFEIARNGQISGDVADFQSESNRKSGEVQMKSLFNPVVDKLSFLNA